MSTAKKDGEMATAPPFLHPSSRRQSVHIGKVVRNARVFNRSRR
jgi:hypothetical protein